MSSRLLLLITSTLFLFSCNKEADIIGENPYAGGKQPLGVIFSDGLPSPQSVSPGDSVMFKVRGLQAWTGKFDFLINGEKTKVLRLSDSTVTVQVPDKVSTGIATINLEGQIFFGPRLTIVNKVSLDINFAIDIGTDGPIYDYCATPGAGVLVGGFTNFQNKLDWWSPFNSIVLLNGQWQWDQTFQKNEAAVGPLYSVGQLSNGQFIVSGNFTSYQGYRSINNITKLNADLKMDTAIVQVINNSIDPKGGYDTVARFNGGTPQVPILKSFVTEDDKIIAIGNFRNYAKALYNESNRNGLKYSYTKISSVMRLTSDGDLDSSYGYVPETGNEGANGLVTDAVRMPDGRLVIVGKFTRFNGVTANNIICLDTAGNVDASFSVGTGSNGQINTVQYNALVDKLVVTGSFTQMKGQTSDGIAVMNSKGQIDEAFKLAKVEGGTISFGVALSSGRIVVSGTFDHYDGITRGGFLILEPDGTALQQYNNIGQFQGQILKVVESQSSKGYPALVLMGSISKFDDQTVGNILRVEIQN